MKFTRKQELALIEIGLKTLVDGLVTSATSRVHEPVKKKWTKAQRQKFMSTMKKKWQAKKNKQTI